MKQMMHRKRVKDGYNRPSSLRKIMTAMKGNKELKPLVQGFVKIKGEAALILGSRHLLNILNGQKEIYVDGTFKVNIRHLFYNRFPYINDFFDFLTE